MSDLVPHEPRRGRPTDLTEEVITKIVSAIRAGVPMRFAAEAAGVSYHTAYHWISMARGNTGNRRIDPDTMALLRRFEEETRQARAQAVMRGVGIVQQAALNGTWQAAAWWLERQFPEEFGRVNRVVVQSAESLEQELTDLLGEDQAQSLVAQARARIAEMKAARLDEGGEES